MDLEALREILAQLSWEEVIKAGGRYETKITTEEVRRIFGKLPPSGAVVLAKIKIMHGPDFQRLSLVRQLRCLPGGKDKPHGK